MYSMDKETFEALQWFMSNFRTVAEHHNQVVSQCKTCEPPFKTILEFIHYSINSSKVSPPDL